MIVDLVLNKLAQIASEKEWPNKKLDQTEIVDILLSVNTTKEIKPLPTLLKRDKIDSGLIELKMTKDPRYINVVTARKIEKNEKKLQKFYFDDKLRLCCPKDEEDCWVNAVNHYSLLVEDENIEEYSDDFEWASDESESVSSNETPNSWDYIVDDIKTTKNVVKEFFF